MRKASTATVAMVVAIALYFMLAWGFDGIRALTSPNYGLEDVWRAQVIFAIGRYAALSPMGLLKLAAFIAAVKLAIAAICGWHLVDRFRSFAGGQARAEVLETAMMIVIAIGIVSAGPAIRSNSVDLLREHVIQVVLAGFAIALCLIERRLGRGEVTQTEETAVPAVREWFSPLRR
jgi:hypothetical protein